MKFKDKRILITGGSSGIGLATAKAFLEEGARVIISASGKERGEKVENELKSIYEDRINFIKCDIENEKEIVSLFDSVREILGGLDVLHNNAGISIGGGLEDTKTEDFDKILRINLRGAFLCSKYAVQLLKDSKGCIVNTISELGLVATKGCLAYICSKGALLQLTRGMACELADFGIRVNAVCPAGTDTPMFREDMGSDGNYNENVKRLAESYPLKRIGKPEDIAPAVLFLAGDGASFITGQYIVLDGGFTII